MEKQLVKFRKLFPSTSHPDFFYVCVEAAFMVNVSIKIAITIATE